MLKFVFWLFCLGFNVETVEYKNISFTVWDVGGQDKVFYLTVELKKKYHKVAIDDVNSVTLSNF